MAIRRAAHQLLDAPVVFADPVALRILGPEQALALRANAAAQERGPIARALRAFLAARSRVAEETLAQLVAAGGVRQYVILGAGLDTFGYRNPYPADQLRVFEVDHPSTQIWKREQLEDSGIDAPDTLTFVPVDFGQQDLTAQLRDAGLLVGEGAFFSWLGVVPYLDEASVWTTLKSIAELSRTGGGVVFDYAMPPDALTPLQRTAFESMAARVAAAGEPWRSFFVPADLEREVRAMGFGQVDDLSGDEINRRYFAGRHDGLRVGSLGRILRALSLNGRKVV